MGFRYDRQPLENVTRTASGALRAPARLTRTGVFVYRNDDGTERREYRPPETVFAADALDALKGATVTRLHPKHSHGVNRVDAANWRKLAIGHVHDDVRQDGDFVAATVTISDADAISQVESRALVELSVGYAVDFEPTPGTTPSGERYDGIQRRVRPNHVALVPRGRAGREAALRLDSEDNERLDAADEEQTPMKKITIGGKVYDEGSPEALAAIQALEERAARADAAEAREKTERSKRLRADVARVKVEFKADADDASIMLEVVKKIAPDVDLSSASPEMIEGAFRVAIAIALKAMGKDAAPEKPAAPAPSAEGANAARADSVDAGRKRADAAEDREDAETADEVRSRHLADIRKRAFAGIA